MKPIFSVGLFIAFTAPLLLASPASAIIRRHDVDDSQYIVDSEDYPALVDLLAPGDCIATLIKTDWLITAAHCAEYFRMPGSLTIGGQAFDVASVNLPTAWQDDLDDIALIELSEPVTHVAPLGLYRGNDEVGQRVWFVGRGDTNTGLNGQQGASVDGQTRRASNRIVAADAWWIEFVFNSPGDSEVTELEGISGDGDSGGPALVETENGLEVVGLSSYQDEGNHSLGTYGVQEFYTRVSQYAQWIEQTMGTSNGTSEEATETGGDNGQPDDAQETYSDPATGSPDSGCSNLGGHTNTQNLIWLLFVGLLAYRCRNKPLFWAQ